MTNGNCRMTPLYKRETRLATRRTAKNRGADQTNLLGSPSNWAIAVQTYRTRLSFRLQAALDMAVSVSATDGIIPFNTRSMVMV